MNFPLGPSSVLRAGVPTGIRVSSSAVLGVKGDRVLIGLKAISIFSMRALNSSVGDWHTPALFCRLVYSHTFPHLVCVDSVWMGVHGAFKEGLTVCAAPWLTLGWQIRLGLIKVCARLCRLCWQGTTWKFGTCKMIAYHLALPATFPDSVQHLSKGSYGIDAVQEATR